MDLGTAGENRTRRGRGNKAILSLSETTLSRFLPWLLQNDLSGTEIAADSLVGQDDCLIDIQLRFDGDFLA